MIQDITPRLNNTHRNLKPKSGDTLLWYQDETILFKETATGIDFLRFDTALTDDPHAFTYLFSIGNKRFFLLTDPSFKAPEGFGAQNVHTLRTKAPQPLTYAGMVGFQLYNWYRNHRFCGRCATPLKKSTEERMLYCPHCGLMEYPKISPAVIVGLTSGNYILMSKYAGRAFKRYALLAGFTEIGETVEETVSREVFEEVGLRVKNLRYFDSQPWGFSDSLLLGFFAEVDGDETITLDHEELAEAQFFHRENMPVEADGFSLTNAMMMAFKNGTDPFSLEALL